MTPEQLRELRDGLPAFADSGVITPLLQAFCRFYSIDFAERLPGLDYRCGTVAANGHTLAVHRWLQADATSNLLLVHGYFDHSGLFGKLIEFGLSRHCNVVIFDLPGHGLSSGEPAAIDDFADYGRAVAAVLAAAALPELPQWVMAQSTGCAALVEYARQQPWPFAAAVMLAPLARPQGWRGVRVAHTVLGPFKASIKRSFTVNSSDKEFLQFLQLDPLQSQRLPLRWVAALRRWLGSLPEADLGVGPVLIVQGDADLTVDWQFNNPFYCKLFPASRLELLPGAGHQLANESAEVCQSYFKCVDDWLKERGVVPAGVGDLA